MKFEKTGAARFTGHLDVMRYFQRAFRRAGLDMQYSEGYHPHPILSFAAPLGLGQTSSGEYLDLGLNSTMSTADALKRINGNMSEGFAVTGYVLLPDDAGNAMASVEAADYTIKFDDELLGRMLGGKRGVCGEARETLAGLIGEYYDGRGAIPVVKKTKKSEREIDLKPLVYEIRAISQSEIMFRVSAGSTDNVSPALIAEDLCRFAGAEHDPLAYHVHRCEMYGERDGKLYKLIDAGKVID